MRLTYQYSNRNHYASHTLRCLHWMNDRYDNAYTCKISCNAVHVKFEVNDFKSQFDMHMMQAQLKNPYIRIRFVSSFVTTLSYAGRKRHCSEMTWKCRSIGQSQFPNCRFFTVMKVCINTCFFFKLHWFFDSIAIWGPSQYKDVLPV